MDLVDSNIVPILLLKAKAIKDILLHCTITLAVSLPQRVEAPPLNYYHETLTLSVNQKTSAKLTEKVITFLHNNKLVSI